MSAVGTAPTGVVAFSFGLRAPAEEPGPCNRRLADATERIVDRHPEGVVVVAQWEVARGLRPSIPRQVVGPLTDQMDRKGQAYLDTGQVWATASSVFHEHGVRRVVPVAHPLLHRFQTSRLIRRDGFALLREPVGWIGFDSSPRNTQWWTRGPLRLCAYALSQALTGRKGR